MTQPATNKLQWWIMGTAVTLLSTVAFAWCSRMTAAIADIPVKLEHAIDAHEGKPHNGTVTHRELDTHIQNTNRRMDELRTWMQRISEQLKDK